MDMTAIRTDYGISGKSFGGMVTAKRTSVKGASSRGVKKKKKVNYNAREISHQLMNTTRAFGVSMVLLRARSKVQYLQRCAVTGQYDESEVKAALAHAKGMVKCAKKRMRHMQREEQAEQKGKKKDISYDRKEENEIRQLVKRELKKIRRKHRNEEDGEIKEVDLRYLREKVRQQQRQTTQESPMSGTEIGQISLEAGDMSQGDMGCTDAGTAVDMLL